MGIADKDEVKQVFQYPLFEAISHRRSRRFPRGAVIDTGARQYTSKLPPVALNDLETALLCWAGAGITGAVLGGDTATNPEAQGPGLYSWLGRAVPFACNNQSTKLFFTNDKGSFVYDPKTATKPVEIETEADREKIMTYFEQDCTMLFPERAEFRREAAAFCLHWNVNKPGTTLFMPIVDQSAQYMNQTFVTFHGGGYKIVDDLKGGRPAGLGKWIDNGTLQGPEVPLSSYEFHAAAVNFSPSSYMLNNINLAAEAMGLGGIIFAGYSGVAMLGITPASKGLGFRSVKTPDGKVNPVGLDGIMEAYCPPYYKNMDEAVDAYVEKKFGSSGTFSSGYPGIVPFKQGKGELDKYAKPDKTVISMVKDYCNYIYDTYGRFPGTTDTILLPHWIQVHHVDEEFYDTYFEGELLNETHRRHMELWHK